MEKEIHGKVYNTDNAVLIVDGLEDDRIFPQNDTMTTWRKVYKKDNGEYFAVVFGGPQTIYRRLESGIPVAAKHLVPLKKVSTFFKKDFLVPKDDNTDTEWSALINACYEDLYSLDF